MEPLNHDDKLRQLFLNVNEWLKFAEAKNFGLLTLNAAIVFGFTQTNFTAESICKSAGYYAFLPFSILSFFICLLSLFPIISKIDNTVNVKNFIDRFCNWIDKEIEFENIHFYGYLRRIDETEFEEKYLAKIKSDVCFNDYERELVTQILYNSRITWLKYQLFKMGAFFFLIGIPCFLLTLIILIFL